MLSGWSRYGRLALCCFILISGIRSIEDVPRSITRFFDNKIVEFIGTMYLEITIVFRYSHVKA